jgi:hypothetical protein
VKATAPIVLVSAVLLVVPAAHANRPPKGEACGASECIGLNAWDTVAPFSSWWYVPFAPIGVPEPAPFFRVVLTSGDPRPTRWTLLYSPARRAMRITQVGPPYGRIGPYWRIVPATARTRIARVLEGIKPFPPSLRWRVS